MMSKRMYIKSGSIYVTKDFNTKQSRDSLIYIKYEWSYDLNYKYILIDFSTVTFTAILNPKKIWKREVWINDKHFYSLKNIFG